MKKIFSIYPSIILGILLLFYFASCHIEEIPRLSTASISGIRETSAICGGVIISDGGETITSKGVCWSTSSPPTVSDSKTTDGSGMASYESIITGLSPNTRYYARAYAKNAAGISYGAEISFTTYHVMDTDGNGYHSVTIGTQIWMMENLRVTRYRNGDMIPNVMSSIEWGGLTSGAFCDYNNVSSTSKVYGRIYNWYAVDDSRNLAPLGWHVATQAEWDTLVAFLGGDDIAGGKLKETGTTLWQPPNTGATNETGFTAVPGGGRGVQGYFSNLGIDCSWWTATEDASITAFGRYVANSIPSCYWFSANKEFGNYVRCVKDQ